MRFSWALFVAVWLAACSDERPVTVDRLPALDPAALLTRIAFGSCSDQTLDQDHWRSITGFGPQVVLMMGDNVYGDLPGDGGSALKPPERLEKAYLALERQPAFRDLRATVPMLATWDDHDYGVNDGGADHEHRAHARRTFLNFWNIPAAAAQAANGGIYDARIIGPEGRRVQIILLDTRSFRSPLKVRPAGSVGSGKYAPDPDPAKTMLGEEQWLWLEQQLLQPAQLRLIVSSIQVIAEGHNFERWGNLPLERQRLYGLIKQTGAGGVVFLSGDRHIAAFYQYDAGVGYPLYEVTSSSLNRPWSDAQERGPFQVGAIFAARNFGTVTVDWEAGTAQFDIRDLEGRPVRQQVVTLAKLVPPAGPVGGGAPKYRPE